MRRTVAAVRNALTGRKEDLDFIRLAKDAFAACPDISLDYAVAERTERAACAVQYRLVRRRQLERAVGNGQQGRRRQRRAWDTLLENTQDCYVRSDGKLTAVVGLKDAIIVKPRMPCSPCTATMRRM